MTMQDALNWFEIPVLDIERAQRFYETLLDISMRREVMAGQALAIFPHAEGRTGGALISGSMASAPSTDGCVVYLDAGPSLDATLARAGELGAKVLMSKVQLPADIGAIAHVVDSEGNRVGLHQRG
jgi:predicted enzyme related to lactoylglutathione lyase